MTQPPQPVGLDDAAIAECVKAIESVNAEIASTAPAHVDMAPSDIGLLGPMYAVYRDWMPGQNSLFRRSADELINALANVSADFGYADEAGAAAVRRQDSVPRQPDSLPRQPDSVPQAK